MNTDKFYCDHHWVANGGKGGKPDFRMNRQMSRFPILYVKCDKCMNRTWLDQYAWEGHKQSRMKR